MNKKKKNKKNLYKYNFGSFVEANSDKIGAGANALGTVGDMFGNEVGNVLSSTGKMAALGTSIAPGIGTAIGAGLGLISGIVGNAKQKQAEEEARLKKQQAFNKAYDTKFNSQLDTANNNPYGQVYADGGDIDPVKSAYDKPYTYKTKAGNIIDNTTMAGYAKGGMDFYGRYDLLGDYVDRLKNPTQQPIRTNNLIYGKNSNKQLTPDEIAYVDKRLSTDQLIGNPWRKFRTNKPDASIVGSNVEMEDTLDNLMVDYRKPKVKYQNGSDIQNNIINIEKGELQIDPQTGKIIREYNNFNPETQGLYEPHSKNEDTKNNFVTAKPGTFVITKAKANDYKKAVDNNDKLYQNSILQNIRNYKNELDKNKPKFANGSDVPYPLKSSINPAYDAYTDFNRITDNAIGLQPINQPRLTNSIYSPQTQMNSRINSPFTSPFSNKVEDKPSTFDKITGIIGNYGPALVNVGKGLFGKVHQEQEATPLINPYLSNIRENMPENVNLDPMRRDLLRNQNNMYNQINETTSGSPIARTNKQNIFANTQDQLGKLGLQEQLQNNQIRGQRANIYSSLGQQDLAEQARTQQLNMGIRESNLANAAAKDNLLATGLSQLQQVYQNDKANKTKFKLDKYKASLLPEIYQNLRFYKDKFGEEAFNKLVKGNMFSND